MNFQPNRTFSFQLGTRHSLYRDGYQYETKPQTNGGRGYAELLFFPTAEGYVKALYKDDQSYHAPAAYQYVYIYKDHLGNNRLSYTLDPKTHQIKILEENHYYPFGLKHGNYNAIRKDVKYQELAASKKEVKQVVPEAVKFKYYYQEQERQDELGLNWDSFKYRNYDYAIGRFMSVDPLAEKYPYNSTYAFQENKLGLGRELEGLELGPKMDVYIANYNAPKHNMTVQEYLDKTRPTLNIHSSSSSINPNYKIGTGTLWSSDANPNNMDRMTPEEKAHSDDHQPWSIDMDNGFNIMLSSYRPSGTKNNSYNVAKNFDSTVDAVNEVTQDNTGQTGNTDTAQNTGNNAGSGDNASGQISNSNTSQSTPDTIYRYQVFYPGQTLPSIDIPVNGQHKLDSVINNTFTGNRPQKRVITKTIVNDNNSTNENQTNSN